MCLSTQLTFIMVIGHTWLIVQSGFAPALPSGRRTQYYYIYEDGAYKYGYDTGEGSHGKAVASPDNEVTGDYAYQSPDGKVDVKYTAGKAGFLPDGFVPSQDGVHVKNSATSSYYYHNNDGSTQGAEEEGPGDASYSFSYNVGDQSRQEVSDPQGNVQGSFIYLSNDGSTRRVDYEAGAEKGFLIKEISPGSSGTVPSAGISNLDGSYAFSYNAGDHSRQESSDANGNVVGRFSFIGKDDNLNRQVDYSAGAERGFIASGSHLQPPTQPISYSNSNQFSQPMAENKGGSFQEGFSAAFSPATSLNNLAGIAVSGNALIGSGLATDSLPGRAYEFSYNAGDHSRHESSDVNGNVVGSFTFVAQDDKINRKIDYLASGDQGFRAFGAHLPVPPTEKNIAVLPSGYNSGQSYSAITQSAHYHTPINSYSSGPASTFSGDSGSYFSGARGIVGVAPNGAYSFSYDAGDHARQETSDGAGNVVGSFTFIPKDDGVRRKVDYAAGAKRGFTAFGDHLPQQPHDITIGSPMVKTRNDNTNYHHDTSGDYDSYHGADEHGDASYSFSYNAGDHTRQESSDSLGNVVGRFSFIAKDDGVNRQVDYESGAEKGFIARGSHLPNAFAYSATLPAAAQFYRANVQGTTKSSSYYGST